MGRILIAGGGIGGLSISIALRSAGVDAVVLERAPEVRAVGAGLVLYPNAIRGLRFLGIAEKVQAAGQPIGPQEIRSSRGRVLAHTNASKLGAADGTPPLGITRAALQGVLLDAAGTGNLRLGHEVRRLRQRPDGVETTTADGREEKGDLLIGADGLRSTVRAALLGEAQPRYAGYTSWRGLAADTALDVSFEAWGAGQRFGAIQVAPEICYWFAVADDRALATLGGREGLDAVQALFHDWAAPVPSILAQTAADAVVRTDIHDRKPTDRWGDGRITLLGDAAHASTPNLGQGAAMAIEDAVVLARCVTAHGVTPKALRAYERTRMARTRRVVLQSRRVGDIGQWRFPALRMLRDRILPVTPEWVYLRQFAWLTHYDAVKAPLAAGTP